MLLSLVGLLQEVEDSAIALNIRQSAWLYPALEIVHIIGIVLLVGPAFMFDLRLLGFSRKIPVNALAGHLLPWSVKGLFLIIPSGLLLFSTNAVTLAADPVFRLKLSLLLAAGVNAGVFHQFLYSGWANQNQVNKVPTSAKVVAVSSIVLWLGIIACGRLLAY